MCFLLFFAASSEALWRLEILWWFHLPQFSLSKPHNQSVLIATQIKSNSLRNYMTFFFIILFLIVVKKTPHNLKFTFLAILSVQFCID